MKKDSEPELAFRKKYLDNAPITSKLNTEIVISDILCKIESYNAEKEDRNTYYLLVRQKS